MTSWQLWRQSACVLGSAACSNGLRQDWTQKGWQVWQALPESQQWLLRCLLRTFKTQSAAEAWLVWTKGVKSLLEQQIKHQYLNSPHKYFRAYSVSGAVGYNDLVNRTDLRGAEVESGVMRKLAIAIYREKDSEVNPERCGTTQKYF